MILSHPRRKHSFGTLIANGTADTFQAVQAAALFEANVQSRSAE
jgi:hypothetical protein